MQPFHRRAFYIAGTVILIAALGLGMAYAKPRPKKLPRIAFGEPCAMGIITKFVPRGLQPKAPAEVMVYKIQSSPPGKAAVLQIFRALPSSSRPKDSLNSAQVEREPGTSDGLVATVGDWQVKVFADGRFGASDLSFPKKREKAPPPDKDKARAVADVLLARLRPLLTRPVHFSDNTLGTDGATRTVFYQAEIDGIPLRDKFLVTVGPGAKPVSLYNDIRHALPYSRVPIWSPQEAIARLRAGEGQTYADGGKTGYVDAIKLYYWEPQETSYLMPVYDFRGETKPVGKLKPGRWWGNLEAIRPEYLEAQDSTKP